MKFENPKRWWTPIEDLKPGQSILASQLDPQPKIKTLSATIWKLHNKWPTRRWRTLNRKTNPLIIRTL